MADLRFADDFGSGTLNSGWTTSSSPSPWSLDTNAGVLKASSLSTETLLTRDVQPNTDYTFQARIKMIQGSDVGIVFRYQDDSNYYLVRASGFDIQATTLWKKHLDSDGVARFYPLKSYAASNLPAPGSWYTLRVSVRGSTISWCYQTDGYQSPVYTATDSTFTGGKAGFRVGNGGANTDQFDDAAASAIPTTYVYDAASELTQVEDKYGYPTSAFTYDGNGNRLTLAAQAGPLNANTFTDDFSGANLDSGWSTVNPTYWSLDQQRLKAVTSSSESLMFRGSAYPDYSFASDINMNSGGTDVGLAFRVADQSNYYFVRASGFDRDASNNPLASLWKRVNGQWKNLSYYPMSLSLVPQAGSWYTLWMAVQGSNIYFAYKIGTTWSQTYTFKDGNNSFPYGGVAIKANSGSGADYFDNVSLSSGWAVSSTSNPWTIGSSTLSASTNGSETIISRGSGGPGSYTFSSDITMTSGTDVGLAFRVEDENNYYMVRASGYDKDASNNPVTTLWKRAGGSWGSGPIASFPMTLVPAANSSYTVKVTVNGSDIFWAYKVGSTWSQTYTASDATLASGGVGLRVGAGGGSNSDQFSNLALASQGYSYDSANELTQIIDAASSKVTSNFSYDAAGNQISAGTSYRLYDERNRLTESASAGASGPTVLYTYDALGNILTRSTRSNIFADSVFASSGTGAWQVPTGANPWSAVSDGGATAYKAASSGSGSSSWRADSASDFSFAAKLKFTATAAGADFSNAGLIFRSDSTSALPDQNEYYFALLPALKDASGNPAPGWRLWKLTGGSTWTSIGQGPASLSMNRYYTLAVKAKGQTFKLYLDGALLASLTDPAPLALGQVGFKVTTADVLFMDARLDGADPTTAATTYRYNDASGALMHELDSNGNITVTYTTDENGNYVSVRRTVAGQEGTYFYHYNAHGDVTSITDASGNTVATFSYDAWGVPTEYGNSGQMEAVGAWAGSPGAGLFLLFGGMFYDAATGLYLTKTRVYDPKTGRFLQRDILDESGKNGSYKGFPFGRDAIGTNLYAWCLNNPEKYIDQKGTDPDPVLCPECYVGPDGRLDNLDLALNVSAANNPVVGWTAPPPYLEQYRNRHAIVYGNPTPPPPPPPSPVPSDQAVAAPGMFPDFQTGIYFHSPFGTEYDQTRYQNRCDEFASDAMNIFPPAAWLDDWYMKKGLSSLTSVDGWKSLGSTLWDDGKRDVAQAYENPLAYTWNGYADLNRSGGACMENTLEGHPTRP